MTAAHSALTITLADPRDPQATALLQASHALMQRLFSPDENHFLSVDALCAADIRFFAAWDGSRMLGTGALRIGTGYGEIKSMFVDPDARGRGVADALLARIEQDARDLHLPLLRLETGDALDAAHRLYARHGFVACAPFGDYTANATSVFMEKPLS